MYLDKILNLWKDLDKSFEEQKEEKGITDKIKYLYYITGYNEEDNSDLLDYMKSLLQEESLKYDDTQLCIYTDLLNKFDSVKLALSRLKFDKISSLNDLVANIVNYTDSVSDIAKFLDEKFFKPYHEVKSNRIYLSPQDIYKKVKSFKDTIIIEDGKVKNYCVNINECGSVLALSSTTQLSNIITKFKQSPTEFLTNVIRCFKYFMNVNKFETVTDLVFISQSLYKLSEDTQSAELYLTGVSENKSYKVVDKLVLEGGHNVYFIKFKVKEGYTKLVLV